MTQQESDLPTELSNPARRALVGAGYVRLEQFTRLSEAEVLRLHGMGPKGGEMIRRALDAKGLSFAEGRNRKEREGETSQVEHIFGSAS